MTDRDFLMCVHARLEHVHNEDPLVDYMCRLRQIIYGYPKDMVTPTTLSFNTMEDLKKVLEYEDKENL